MDAGGTLSNIVHDAFPLIDRAHHGRHPTAATSLNHRFNCRTRTGKHGLDRAIATIAHPAVQSASIRFVFDESAIADALNPAAHYDMPNDDVAHAGSPASTMREPVQREADQCSTERIYGSGNFQPRAAEATIST